MTPIELLNDFIDNMLQWETEFHIKRRTQEYKQNIILQKQHDKEARVRLEIIFNAYLSTSALEAEAMGRLGMLNTGQPPEYAQQVLIESEVKSREMVYIETLNQKDVVPHRRYAIVMENYSPKIDAVYSRLTEAEKWRRRLSI
ncbi:NTF2 fold immunity protein [Ditylenchus destructor]|nr:NTF2 fold immunity protein [Ditylenchus destructor]